MKHLIYILFFSVIGLTACQRPAAYPLAMQQAEELMNARPDSAWQLLQGMEDTVPLLPEEARMYWHLLTIQAKDKLYITHTDDSLITRIVQYYEASDDKDRLMMAYFYQGATYRDMNDAPRALKAYHQAIDAGEGKENLTLIGMIHSQMGDLFAYQELYDEALNSYRSALSHFESEKGSFRIPLTMRNIARMYNAKTLNDSSLYYYEQAYMQADKQNALQQMNSITGELGCLYYEMGEKKKSREILFNLSLQSKLTTNVILHLGFIYGDENHLDSARYYLAQVIRTGNIYKKSSAYQYLSNLEERQGNTQRAAVYHQKYEQLRDSIQKITRSRQIEKKHLTYNYQRIKKENVSLKKNHTNLKVTTVLFTVSISVVLCCILFYKRKNSIKTEEYSFFDFTATTEYLLFQQAGLGEYRVKEEDWKKLLKVFYAAYPSFVSRLNKIKGVSKLSEHELRICYLTKMKFNNTMISHILCVSTSAVSHARSRIYYKLTEEEGNASKFAHFIGKL